jgi:hypothetical protein
MKIKMKKVGETEFNKFIRDSHALPKSLEMIGSTVKIKFYVEFDEVATKTEKPNKNIYKVLV